MMAAKRAPKGLIDQLPEVRGRYSADAALAKLTWFRVGGPAEVLFRPADEEDLKKFLAAKPADVPVTVLGVGSNLLVRDGGIPGVVIRLGDAFADITVDGNTIVAGGGASNLKVANVARSAKLAGFEFLSGIPGSIGGAVRMNAGAFGSETSEILVSATAVDAQGRLHTALAADLGMSYRHCSAPDDWLFLSATLMGTPGDVGEIARRMEDIRDMRETVQPTKTPTGGSTFVNPPGAKAWELIDRAGCRGLKRGGAMVSEKHCNFLINTGTATAADLEGLGEEVRRRVFEHSGVKLQWEIRRIGVPAGPPVKEFVEEAGS